MTWKGGSCCCGGVRSGGDFLCLLLLLMGFLLPACRTRLYTNHWAVRISGGLPEANRIASKYGYINIGQIGALKDYYHFYHSKTIKRSVLSSRGTHNFISMEPKVEWIEQQIVKIRRKRDYKPVSMQTMYFNDPKWQSMWYMHCSDNTHLCQSDMNIVGAWKRGYTGKNIVITILDDGIERNHPDLTQNYDPDASFDVNGNDIDPMPRYDASNENKIGGVRMLDGDVTDMVEAKSLSLNPQHIHIYSASWGPDDDGKTVDGPASLTRQAFENGVRTGRNNLGSIYVWASGNGGRSKDHCSCDGYTNSIYTISISSTAESGRKPWYLEECASTLATTYSSGESYDRKIITTDLRQRCTDSHTGTSASAPMAAGIIALALEANRLLTWRDIQHIIVRTSQARHLIANDWKTNAAGYKVSHLYGYGLMDAEAMVVEAEKWTTVPPQHVCIENTDRQIKTIRPDNIRNGPDNGVRSIYKATGCADNANHHVIYLEHVVVRITITHPRRGDLAIYLTSPSGTRSQLLSNRLFDHSMEGFKNWEFMTTHCWGEKAAGDWILEIYDTPSQLRNVKTPGKLKEWSLVLYGTSIQPYSPRNDFLKGERIRMSPIEDPTEDYGLDDYSGPCNAECSKVGCGGPGPDHCNDCLHYYYKSKNNTRICVPNCPPGHYSADKKRCKKCSPNCETCFGSHSDQCSTCKPGYFINEESRSCITSCPDSFYLDNNKIVCRKCSENCRSCTEFHTCTECRYGLSLQGTRCVIRCEAGKYYNGRDCEPCHHSCASCEGPGADACINCTEEYFMENGKCVATCRNGYYLDHSLENGYKTCKRCDVSCFGCSGPGERNCTSCPSGYILDTGLCVFCDISCSKCTGPTSKDCIGCTYANKVLDDGHCIVQCPRGKFEFNKQCHSCHESCMECSGSEPNECTSCAKDKKGHMRFLYLGECRKSCPLGFYPSEADGTCAPCFKHCQECLNQTSCERYDQQCYRTCPQNTVSDDNSHVCIECQPNCQSCDRYECYWCEEGGTCVRDCGAGFYKDEITEECEPCYKTCKTCRGVYYNDCTSCQGNLQLLHGKCVNHQHKGKHGKFWNKKLKLHTSDVLGSAFLKGRFFPYVPSRFLQSAEIDLFSVSSRHQIEMERALKEAFLENARVLPKAFPFKAHQNPSLSCVFLPSICTMGACNETCRTCSSGTKCLSCEEGLLMTSSGLCVIPQYCLPNQYYDREGRTCRPCHKDCLHCKGPDNFQYYVNSDTRTCARCHTSCQKCLGPAPTECLSCVENFFLLHSSGQCVSSCPEYYYADFDTQSCERCHPICHTCNVI
ncbi:Proprotein convertase subtilisin/kexin type 5, partial [Ophiophagus hannah]